MRTLAAGALLTAGFAVQALAATATGDLTITVTGPPAGGAGTLSLAIGPVGGPYTSVPMQMDEVGTYGFNGEPASNGIRTANFSTRVPSVPAGGTFQVQISYNGVPVAIRTEQNAGAAGTDVPFTFGTAFQRGTIPSVSYTPGAGLPFSAAASAHDVKVIFGSSAIPVRDGNGATIGSGVWVCDANALAALGAYTKNGGYRVTSNGALMTSYAVDGPCVDQVNGSPAGAQLWAHFPSIELWQTAPNSGVLGEVRVENPWVANGPWLNVAAGATGVYTGDMALYDGSTLIAQRSTGLGSAEGPFSIQPSAVTTGINGTCGAGTVSTNFQLPTTLQDGEPVLYNGPAAGGAPIGGMTPGRVYFYGSSLAGSGKGNLVLSPASQNGGGNPLTCPDVTSPGVGPQNFTPVASANYRAVAIIGPDEVGSPLWLAAANPAPAVHLNPALTTAEISYLEVAGVIPSYYTDLPALPLYKAQGNKGGPLYRPNSTGLGDVDDGAGGDHDGLGPLSEWEARALLSENSAAWDGVRATALSVMNIPTLMTLNEATGYLPALNNKTYPQLGAGLPNVFWTYTGNGVSAGMEIPPTATGDTCPSCFLGGMLAGVDGMHWEDYGQWLMALLTGDRSMIDVQYFAANAQPMNMNVDTFGIGSRNFTMGGTPYTARISFTDSMRRTAWEMREVMRGSTIGSDSNPEKQYEFDVLAGDVDNFWTVTHVYADPGMAAIGVTEGISDFQANFMAAYETTSFCGLKGLIRYTSPITGGSTAAECDYMTLWPELLWASSWPTFWAATEQITDTFPSAFMAAPDQLPHANGPSEIFTHSNAGFLSVDATGLFTASGGLFPQMQNGDAGVIWDLNPNNDFSPTTKYFTYNVTQPAETFRLSTTCTVATALNPCPSPAVTPFVPAHGPYSAGTNFSMAFQFAYNPPTGPAANSEGGQSSSDYVVWARSGMASGLNNGATTPSLATAFANADARFVYPTRWDDADRWAIDPAVRVH